MTDEEIRALLTERFGPLRELQREGRTVTQRREIARRRRVLTELQRKGKS